MEMEAAVEHQEMRGEMLLTLSDAMTNDVELDHLVDQKNGKTFEVGVDARTGKVLENDAEGANADCVEVKGWRFRGSPPCQTIARGWDTHSTPAAASATSLRLPCSMQANGRQTRGKSVGAEPHAVACRKDGHHRKSATYQVRALRFFVALVLAGVARPSCAGPPYLTDDPVPTDEGHWEIYAFSAGEGRHSNFDADAGFDLNYGPVEDVQLTATLPLSFSHAPLEGWRGGAGDVELGIKYRFFHDAEKGLSAAVFPRTILPTASHSPSEQMRFLLPLWVGKDFAGGTSLFGGGGYTINQGSGNRDFWQAAAAVTHDVSKKLSLGAEVTRQGSDAAGGTAQTRASLGTFVKIAPHYALLLSGGPSWADQQTSYHFYAAFGLIF
jgi:hypothetical protein